MISNFLVELEEQVREEDCSFIMGFDLVMMAMVV